MTRRLKLLVGSLTILLGSITPALTSASHVFAVSNGYAASDVLGQLDGGGNPDFTTSNSGTSATTLWYPAGTAIDTMHHRLFVNDSQNYRTLIYKLDTTNNLEDHAADYVLGQPDLTTPGSSPVPEAQNTLFDPYLGIAYDSANDRVFIPDNNGNGRIMIYDLAGGITNGMNASYVLGEPDFTTVGSNYWGGQDLTYDPVHKRLFAAGGFITNRILVYDLAGGITNGMTPSHVLGQPDLTDTTPRTTQNGFDGPESTVFNPTTQQLFVGDTNNRRVMVFNLAGGITDNMNASYVLGQPDFTSATPHADQMGVGHYIEGLGIDSERNILYASDDNNNRVLVFNLAGGITNGMNANMVLGQPDFTSTTSATTQAGLNDIESSIAVDPSNNRIYVGDSSNNRIMIYDFAKLFPSSNTALSSPVLGQPYSYDLGFQTRGTPTFSIAAGTPPTGLVLGATTGVLSGTPTSNGTFNFVVKMEDDIGSAGIYVEQKSFSFVLGDSTTTPQLTNTGTPIILTTGGAALLILGAQVTYRNRQKLYRLYGRR